MSRPNDIKKVFGQFCTERDINPETLREEEAIALFKVFYDEVGFDGRQRGTSDDKLLFQTDNVSSPDRWTIAITRQLYKHGRGIKLTLSWTYGGPSFLANVSLESDNAGTWAADATKEVVTIGVEDKNPTAFAITHDQF